MTQQFTFTISGFNRGIHLITKDVLKELDKAGINLPDAGIYHYL